MTDDIKAALDAAGTAAWDAQDDGYDNMARAAIVAFLERVPELDGDGKFLPLDYLSRAQPYTPARILAAIRETEK